MHDGADLSVSEFSCYACKRRKVKCNRALPICALCNKFSGICEYPTCNKKPGPKIGSTQKNTRRRVNTRNGRLTKRDSPPNLRETAASSHILPTDSHKLLCEAGVPQRESTSHALPSRKSPQLTTSDDGHNIPASATTFTQIMHPSHEVQSRPKSPHSFGGTASEVILERVCDGLAISKNLYNYLYASHHINQGNSMDSYFHNMTTFTLFKPYKIEQKLAHMQSSAEAEALVAAMFAFAARFHACFNTPSRPVECPAPSYFASLASKRLEEAIEQLGDSVAPLWLVQAYILLSFYQLTQSVRSKAWRYLGICIRLAYELGLHRVDSQSHRQIDIESCNIHLDNCSILEEKRRAWWAIWEMDVLASAIRRLPMAINWNHNYTFLPIPDSCWFNDISQKSCYLALDPNLRWKHLCESGNPSPKAWYIVINSFVHNCQSLLPEFGFGTDSTTTMADVTIMTNCLYCITNSLPPELVYHGQVLDFQTRNSPQDISCHQYHNDIYCIHLITQLVRFMLYHHQIATQAPWLAQFQTKNLNVGNECKFTNLSLWSNYMEISENVITMVRNSSGEHYKYINPFMTNTLWIAAAAQIACRIFGPLTLNKQLAESNYELLCLNIDRSIVFWCGMSVLKRRLSSVEALLKGLMAKQGTDSSSLDLAGFVTAGLVASQQDASLSDSSILSDSLQYSPINSNTISLLPHLGNSMESEVSIDHGNFFAGIEQFFPYGMNDSWINTKFPQMQ